VLHTKRFISCFYVSGVRAYVEDFAALVRVVQHAHGLGIFHRDISISNIFYDKQSNEIFLNDWSSAHKRRSSTAASPFPSQEDSSVKWVGTPYFSCSRADGHGNHVPTAADDLCSMVKCAQLSYCNQLLPMLQETKREEYFAREILQVPYWRTAWDLGERCDYDSLAAHFIQL
jgi:serine/threonine protein kinase